MRTSTKAVALGGANRLPQVEKDFLRLSLLSFFSCGNKEARGRPFFVTAASGGGATFGCCLSCFM